MKKTIFNRFGFIVLLSIFSLVIALPSTVWTGVIGEDSAFGVKLTELKVALGLDLQGGTELDYKVDLTEPLAQNSDEDPLNDVNLNIIVESVRDALEKRVNPAGVGEIVVKRSQINEEEHILIQMPPNTDVDKAKSDAERDNRLEFFAENQDLSKAKRVEMAGVLTGLNNANFATEAERLAAESEIVTYEHFGPLFQSELTDPGLATKLFKADANTILEQVTETTIQPSYEITADGEIKFEGSIVPRTVLAIVRVTDKELVEREQIIEEKAKARHILFGYNGAAMAEEDGPYATAEIAKAKAEETLAKLQSEGTDNFGDLAKELSTEGAAQRSFGELGEFGQGQMVGPFNDAVFKAEAPGLIGEVIETDFGYHVIEIQSLTAAGKTVEQEPKLSYELITWDLGEVNWESTELGGKQLEAASVGFDQVGQPLVNLRFDQEGGDLFGQLTETVAGRFCEGGSCRLGIKVGGNWISQPTVRQKIVGRDSQITGNFTFDSAHDLADGLNLGAIDAPVILSGQTTIGAKLGEDQLSKSLKAALFGFIATMIFMVIMYRFAGVVASLSLILYAGLFVTILKTWPTSFGGPIVLSLAGAAGIALSIGLAVDGNILIFERMKEEIRRGRTLSQSVDLGFERAWTAIRDSNLTTLLTCVILFTMGSSIIKGFAITLIVGTLLSMFTAINVSRNLLRFFLLFKPFQKPELFGVKSADIGKKVSGAKIRKRKK